MSILIVGDSFSALNDKYVVWSSILGQRLGKRIFNHARSGSGFIKPGGAVPPRRFSRQILEHRDLDPADIELGILFGSVNDKSEIAERLDYYRIMVFTTLREAHREYPKAKWLIILPQWSGPNPEPPELDVMKKVFYDEMYGYDFEYGYVDPNQTGDVPNWWFPPDRPEFWETADQFHPNQLGHTRMADKIEPHVRKILGIS